MKFRKDKSGKVFMETTTTQVVSKDWLQANEAAANDAIRTFGETEKRIKSGRFTSQEYEIFAQNMDFRVLSGNDVIPSVNELADEYLRSLAAQVAEKKAVLKGLGAVKKMFEK